MNLGLLLALAGLDYSKVQEPTWQRQTVSQSASLTAQVAQICAEVLSLWERRSEADLEEIFGRQDFFERRRHIHYDTDNIYEQQQEYIRLCPSCAGWRVIYTVSNVHPTPSAAVLIPWHVCPQCLKEGESHYQRERENTEFGLVIWHDPRTDSCKV